MVRELCGKEHDHRVNVESVITPPRVACSSALPERDMQGSTPASDTGLKAHTLRSNSIPYFFRYPMRLLIRGEGRDPREEAHG